MNCLVDFIKKPEREDCGQLVGQVSILKTNYDCLGSVLGHIGIINLIILLKIVKKKIVKNNCNSNITRKRTLRIVIFIRKLNPSQNHKSS